MKLTKAQERAKATLTREWQSPYDVCESISMLERLVELRVAEKQSDGIQPSRDWGDTFNCRPGALIHYRLAL